MPTAGAVRTLLVTGAAGAGRTTVATATAARAARDGTPTLLLTRDRAAATALVRAPAGPDEPAGPGSVQVEPGLWIGGIDPAETFQGGALEFQGRIGGLLTFLGAAPMDPEELTVLPGADALALLRSVRQAYGEEDGGDGNPPPWDLVVVDLPPVRDALTLLALPEQLRRYLRRLLPADRQAARALRPVLAQLAGVPMPAEWAYEAAARADRRLAAAQAVIEDAGTSVAVVLEPGEQAQATLRTARAGLALFGHRLAGVAANRLLPTGSADPFLAGLSGRQQEQLKALADQCAADGVPLRELPHLGRPPQEPAELAALAVGTEHGSSQTGAAGSTRPDPWAVRDLLRDEGWFEWSLPLPGAGRDGLDLVRRGDELVVDAGGFRRIVPLPSALRRCTVSGAALRDGVLRVRFTPDPDLWPR